MNKKRRIPVTEQNRSKVKKHNEFIRTFHVLLKQGNESDLLAMGGLQEYQNASKRGEKGGMTSKWLVNQLDKRERTVLDVGAIHGTQYDKYKYLKVTSIDLNSQSVRVKKQDFLLMDMTEKFDVVCLSLVLNFEPDAQKRGQMLLKSKLCVKDNGLVFIVLPLPCVDNSRYFTKDRLIEIMELFGFKVLETHFSAKLAYFLFQSTSLLDKVGLKQMKKTELNPGPKRNNFCITFDPALSSFG
jgi:25S rRNA (adenine2142-N1)-methyltransferase